MSPRPSPWLFGGDLPGRIGRRLRSRGERWGHRLGLPGPDPGEVRLAAGFRHPVDAARRPALVAQYRSRFPAGVEAELAEARRLLRHRFTFLGHAWEEGSRIAWSRDPVSGREWSRGFSPDIAYRGPGRLGDIKLPWELNKHQYFFTLGKASWLGEDPEPAREIVRQIEAWTEDNPYRRGIHWVSALETGTRAVSWILAHPFYREHGDEGFGDRLARSLALHMLFVERNLSRGRFTNTHLVGEAVALVAGGLFLEGPRCERWLSTGLAILEEEISRQVLADGVHAEQSVAYHRYFLDNYHLAGGLLAANGRSLPAAVLGVMERMTEFLRDVLYPDGSAPAFGDGDDARALWFRADCPADYRSLLALGAVVHGRGDFRAASGDLCEEVLWLLGEGGVARFDALEAAGAAADARASAAYPDGGYYLLRGGRQEADPVLAFDCGPLGHGPAGHGHADALSFQLFAGGYPFLVDPGTFSYNLDYRWRDAFRSTRAHNTVVVDGQDQSVPGDRMSWSTRAAARCRRWIPGRWFDLVEGEHDGYLRLPDPVSHRRVVLYLRPDVWIVWDRLQGAARHRLESLLHLRPDCSVEREPGTGGLFLAAPGGARLHLRMVGAGGEGVSPELLRGDEGGGVGWFSPVYGSKVPSQAIVFRREFGGEASLVLILAASPDPAVSCTVRDGCLGVALNRGSVRTTVSYSPERRLRRGEEGEVFDGALLFLSSEQGRAPVIWAGGFRELSVPGHAEVRAPGSVKTFVLEGDRADVEVAPELAGSVGVRCGPGVRSRVNGRRVP